MGLWPYGAARFVEALPAANRGREMFDVEFEQVGNQSTA
jgi:hypothetical protein